MKIVPRPYQAAMIEETADAFRAGVSSVCWQLSTGGGKTATACPVIERSVSKGYRVVFLAHLSDLITDTHERLKEFGVRSGFVQANRPSDPTARVQVASLQTLTARGRLALPPADIVILDEAHRCQGPTVRAILEAYPEAVRLGLTATPQRGDGKPLGDLFSKLISGPSMPWLTSQGFLVPCDVLAPGDPQVGKLSMDPVEAYRRYTPGRKAIVFAGSLAEAKDLVARFGPRAALFIGDTNLEERERLKAGIKSGKLDILVGMNVFVEGFDLPEIECVVLARPFSVCGAYLQAIGRGLRIAPWVGKRRCTVLDLCGSYAIHGLPDELRKWSLEGVAVSRTEVLTALARCNECGAVFRPAKACPRCGTSMTVATKRIKRKVKRVSALEKVSDWPTWKRDELAMRQLRNVAMRARNVPMGEKENWARTLFFRRFKRNPVPREEP